MIFVRHQICLLWLFMLCSWLCWIG